MIGNYTGGGLGFSSGGDGVNIFDAAGTAVFSVGFGAGTAGFTFDNAAGMSGTISTLSSIGVNGAFASLTGGEVGSPGRITAIPEPGSIAILAVGAMAIVVRTKFRARRAVGCKIATL